MNRIAKILTVLIAASTVATLAWAQADIKDEAQALNRANVSLEQAINNALQAVPGQALSAGLDEDEGAPTFVVEVVKQAQVYEVSVDARNGKVVSKEIDAADVDGHDGDHDGDHDQDRD